MFFGKTSPSNFIIQSGIITASHSPREKHLCKLQFIALKFNGLHYAPKGPQPHKQGQEKRPAETYDKVISSDGLVRKAL